MQFTMWRKPTSRDCASGSEPPTTGEPGLRILRSREELEEAWQRAANAEQRLRRAVKPCYSHYLGPTPRPREPGAA